MLALVCSPGCLVLKSQHDELAAKVSKLERSQDARSAELDQKVVEADARLAELNAKLDEAERLLRGSQAGIGARMDTVEEEVRELRGQTDQASYVSAATVKEARELRSEVDARLAALEQKVNEATNIPEDKGQLLAEADRLAKQRSFVNARRLYRTYLARYAGDPKLPEVKFKIGQTFFNERDYKSSLGEFYKIIQEHRDSPVIADALYYSGLAFAKLGQCQNALPYFEAILKPTANAPAQYVKAAKGQIEILQKDSGDICLDKDDATAGAAGEKGVREGGKI